MIVTAEANGRNQRQALVAAGLVAWAAGLLVWLSPALWVLLGLIPFHVLVGAATVSSADDGDAAAVSCQWEQILRAHVAFFEALDDAGKARFRQLVQIFLDEVRITGIRTEVDDTIRVLVAASAAIPIFGFHDWEYHRLHEVLIYPDAFDDAYQSRGGSDENDSWDGRAAPFERGDDSLQAGPPGGIRPSIGKQNVGVHEFAHLVEKEASEYGLPPEVPWMVVRQWVRYVARELARPPKHRAHISAYAYTNEHEFFAVLAEYFFTSPESVETSGSRLVRHAAGHVSPGHGVAAPLGAPAPPGDRPQRALSLRQRQEIQALLLRWECEERIAGAKSLWQMAEG